MKTKFKYVTLMALALTVGFSSCSKDNQNGKTPSTGFATVNIQASQEALTYAAPNTGTTGGEALLASASAYIFDETGVLKHTVTLALGAGNTTASGKQAAMVSGTYNFYVVANPTAALTASLGAITAETAFVQATTSAAAAVDMDYLTPAAGFFMTGITPVTRILAPGTSVTIPIQIGRAFAKTRLEFDNPTMNVDGTLTSVEYLVANNPANSYNQLNLDANVFQSWNWAATYANTGSTTTADGTIYMPKGSSFTVTGVLGQEVVTPAALIAAGTTTYAMENSIKEPKNGNVTTVQLVGDFAPNTLYDATSSATPTTVTYTAGDDFYRIAETDVAGTAIITYTDVLLDAVAPNTDLVAFLANIPGTPAVTVPANLVVLKYTGGKMYYNVQLRDPAALAAAKGAEEVYAVKRNKYYDVNITRVNALGNNHPNIVNPTIPPTTTVDIEANISILPWDLADNSTDL